MQHPHLLGGVEVTLVGEDFVVARHGAAHVAEVDGEELALSAEAAQGGSHVGAGLLEGAQAEEQAHAGVGVAVEQALKPFGSGEGLGDASVDGQRGIVGVEAQTDTGGAGRRQDGLHEAIEAAPDFRLVDARAVGTGAAPTDEVGVVQAGGVKGAQHGAGAPQGLVAIAAPVVLALVGMGDGEAAGEQVDAVVPQQADGLAQGLELPGGARRVALEDSGDQRAAKLHARQRQVELRETPQKRAKALRVHAATGVSRARKPDPAQRAAVDTQLPHELQVLAGRAGVAEAELDHGGHRSGAGPTALEWRAGRHETLRNFCTCSSVPI